MKVAKRTEVAICVRNLDKMLAFYRDTLGMSVWSIDDISAAQSSRAQLCASGYRIARLETEGHDHIKLVAPNDALEMQVDVPFVMGRHGFAYLTFIVPDLTALLSRLDATGATFKTGKNSVSFRPGIVDLAFVQDPEGNFLEFVERKDLDTYWPE